MTKATRIRVAATMGGLVVAAVLSPLVGVASAQPGDGPLMHTTCSYTQLTEALRVEMPAAAAKLDNNPEAQAKMQAFFALPVDQRQQRFQERLDANPELQAKMDAQRDTPEGQEKRQKLTQIADTCHSY